MVLQVSLLRQLLIGSMMLFATVSAPSLVSEQSKVVPATEGPEGTWQGTLHASRDFRTVVKIHKSVDGPFKSEFYSIDQGGKNIGVKLTTISEGNIQLDVENIGGLFTGKLSTDGQTITGQWTQDGKSIPLVLVRSTNETAWPIPDPPKPLAPMAKDGNPMWDVATIKPAPPEERGKGFGGPPRHFSTENTTLNDLISYAYHLNAKQIVGGPKWMAVERYDITTGEPNLPGAPNQEQLKAMLRRLIEQRFSVKFHAGKQQMAAYVLSVARGGPKLNRSQADHQIGAFYFPGKLGTLVFRDNTLDMFCSGLQSTVFDRPVVNHTGLEGYWDGALKWTPDESQFKVFDVKIVPDESQDAPPPFFSAIQEQLGLRLTAEKTAVDVMVLDHVDKPSGN